MNRTLLWVLTVCMLGWLIAVSCAFVHVYLKSKPTLEEELIDVRRLKAEGVRRVVCMRCINRLTPEQKEEYIKALWETPLGDPWPQLPYEED